MDITCNNQSNQINFHFDVTPVSCARPRLGKFRVYTPKTTYDYKKLLADLLHLELQRSPELQEKISGLYYGPVSLTVSFYLPIPQRLIKKKDPQPWKVTLPVTKPDTDNLVKSVKDVLTGQIFKDDSQVTHEIVRKLYSERPRVEIIVRPSTVETYNHIFNTD